MGLVVAVIVLLAGIAAFLLYRSRGVPDQLAKFLAENRQIAVQNDPKARGVRLELRHGSKGGLIVKLVSVDKTIHVRELSVVKTLSFHFYDGGGVEIEPSRYLVEDYPPDPFEPAMELSPGSSTSIEVSWERISERYDGVQDAKYVVVTYMGARDYKQDPFLPLDLTDVTLYSNALAR